MTTRSGDDDPDAAWRRPSEQPGDASDRPAPPAGGGPAVHPQPPTAPPAPPEISGYARPGSDDPGYARPTQNESGYAGPPRNTPPPPGWRPPMHVEPPPPRQLPQQDEDGLDQEERGARTLTIGVALVASAILVVVVCLLCSRLLF